MEDPSVRPMGLFHLRGARLGSVKHPDREQQHDP